MSNYDYNDSGGGDAAMWIIAQILIVAADVAAYAVSDDIGWVIGVTLAGETIAGALIGDN